MKVFTSICLSLVLCQIGRASVLPGQVDKQPLGDIIHYNSGLKSVSPLSSDSSLLTSCNGVINATSGGIAYKAFEPIATNERCVWTIRGGRAGGFSLNVLNLGISNNSTNTQVVATCLRLGVSATHNIIRTTGPVDRLSNCDLLLITFASGSDIDNSTGFVLEYSVLSSTVVSPQSQDYIIDAGEAGIVRYPNSASRYGSYELNTFIILPNLGSYTNVIYFRDSLEGTSCHDFLSVYRFNATNVVSTKWQYEGRICGNIPSDLIINDDLILITFDTDMSVSGNGFQLAITGNGASQCQL